MEGGGIDKNNYTQNFYTFIRPFFISINFKNSCGGSLPSSPHGSVPVTDDTSYYVDTVDI